MKLVSTHDMLEIDDGKESKDMEFFILERWLAQRTLACSFDLSSVFLSQQISEQYFQP